MSRWSKLYEEEINRTTVDNYILEKLKTKKKIIKLINKYADHHKVMELGAGTGILAIYLSTLNHQVIAIDKDKDMITLSKKYFLDKFKNTNIHYICSDIRSMSNTKQFDIIYSIGILEHYSDSEIIELIHKQISMCNTVIFGIPTKYFDENKKMYGNERYLPIKYWRKLIKQSGCEIIEESSYHYLNIFQRLWNPKKYFKPNPVHIFCIKKNKGGILWHGHLTN